MTVYRAQGVKYAPCAVFGCFLACFIVRRLAAVRSCRTRPPNLHKDRGCSHHKFPDTEK